MGLDPPCCHMVAYIYLLKDNFLKLMLCLPMQVVWGKISMIDAERRLLANALKDPDNQHFVLLSDR